MPGFEAIVHDIVFAIASVNISQYMQSRSCPSGLLHQILVAKASNIKVELWKHMGRKDICIHRNRASQYVLFCWILKSLGSSSWVHGLP